MSRFSTKDNWDYRVGKDGNDKFNFHLLRHYAPGWKKQPEIEAEMQDKGPNSKLGQVLSYFFRNKF